MIFSSKLVQRFSVVVLGSVCCSDLQSDIVLYAVAVPAIDLLHSSCPRYDLHFFLPFLFSPSEATTLFLVYFGLGFLRTLLRTAHLHGSF
jgi:hypothetical protein